MTSAQKVLETERQVRAMLDGTQEPVFTCPFCTMVSEVGQFLCCQPAGDVISAVLDHVDHIGRCEVIEKTFDRLSNLPAPSMLVMN